MEKKKRNAQAETAGEKEIGHKQRQLHAHNDTHDYVVCTLCNVHSFCMNVYVYVCIVHTDDMRNEKWQFLVKLNWKRRRTAVNIYNVDIRCWIQNATMDINERIIHYALLYARL